MNDAERSDWWAREYYKQLESCHMLQEIISQLAKERDAFFYWAEQLSSHGFNVTMEHGGNEEFYPLASEYWNEMAEAREALAKEGKVEGKE